MTDEDRFTLGDCYVLALELHRRTGWDLYAFDGGSWRGNGHAFVVMPDGRALDVRGAQEIESFMARWGYHAVMPVKDSWLREEWQGWCAKTQRKAPVYGWTSWPKARKIARELLDALGVVV